MKGKKTMKLVKVLLSIIIGLGVIFGALTVANHINKQAMFDYIDTFSKVEYENQLTPSEDELGVYFTTDGDFRIMHLTDIHIGGSAVSATDDKKAFNAIAAMVHAEKPDLVVITGDISFAVPWGFTLNNQHAHSMFIRFMEQLGVYYTVAFGNHDSEKYNFYNRQAVAGFYSDESLKYSLFSAGPADIYGECNHSITVRNTHGLITQSLIMIDTNAYTDEDPLGLGWVYDNIHEDQIEWYRSTVEAQTAYNNSLGSNEATVKSLIFMHIPLMEMKDAAFLYLEESEEVIYHGGKIGESEPSVYPPETPDNMFETVLELGSTQAMFYGHDHLNNIVLEYKGVTLSYGYSIDYFAYIDIDKVGSQRGCTMITCKPDTTVEIVHENYYQDKYVPLYDKEVVDLTN